MENEEAYMRTIGMEGIIGKTMETNLGP